MKSLTSRKEKRIPGPEENQVDPVEDSKRYWLGWRSPADNYSVWMGATGRQHRGEREEQVYQTSGRQHL
jgi:hypothetical protein